MMEIKPKTKSTFLNQSVVMLFEAMAKYLEAFPLLLCGAEQDYLVNESTRSRNDPWSLRLGCTPRDTKHAEHKVKL